MTTSRRRPVPVRSDEALTAAERARAILEARARRLADAPAEERADEASIEIAVFDLAGERYGLEARYVREIARVTALAPLPGAPELVAGVVSRRGEIIAVLDVRRLFRVPAGGLSDLARLIVLGEERAEFAILADAVRDVVRLPCSEIGAVPSGFGGEGREYLRGVTKNGLVVLEGAVLLSDQRLFGDGDAAEVGAST